MSKQDNIHADHRKRLRAKVMKTGLDDLAEHEVLEFLLTYAIPRKDTNPTAHNLIDRFGSFSKVLDADINDLQKVKGMGESSALFVGILKQVFEYYRANKTENVMYKLDSISKFVQYFRENYKIENKERFYVFCLTKSCNIVKMLSFSGEDAAKVTCDAREFAQIVSNKRVENVFLAHTHPNGMARPSADDILSTKRIKLMCDTIGINVIDHIIFTELEHYSFKTNTNILN